MNHFESVPAAIVAMKKAVADGNGRTAHWIADLIAGWAANDETITADERAAVYAECDAVFKNVPLYDAAEIWTGVRDFAYEDIEREIRDGKRCPECFEIIGPMGDCDCPDNVELAVELAAELADMTAGDDIPAAITADVDQGWIDPVAVEMARAISERVGSPMLASDPLAQAAVATAVQARSALAAHDTEEFMAEHPGVNDKMQDRAADNTRREMDRLFGEWAVVRELAAERGFDRDMLRDAIAAVAPMPSVNVHPNPAGFIRSVMY